jgi:hypothetical protein
MQAPHKHNNTKTIASAACTLPRPMVLQCTMAPILCSLLRLRAAMLRLLPFVLYWRVRAVWAARCVMRRRAARCGVAAGMAGQGGGAGAPPCLPFLSLALSPKYGQ